MCIAEVCTWNPFCFHSRCGPDLSPHWKNNVCDRCYSGSYGRIALFEILPLDAALSRHIIEGATADDIEAFARANGMETLLIQGMRAVEDGLTTPEEIYRVLDVPHDK